MAVSMKNPTLAGGYSLGMVHVEESNLPGL